MKVFLAGSSDQLAFAWNCESKLDNNYEFVSKRKSQFGGGGVLFLHVRMCDPCVHVYVCLCVALVCVQMHVHVHAEARV